MEAKQKEVDNKNLFDNRISRYIFDNIDIYTTYNSRVSYFASLWRTQEQAYAHVFHLHVFL